MKITHNTYTHGELVEFRPIIRKILLQNLRSIVMAIQSRNLGPIRSSNNVGCVFYIFHLLLDADTIKANCEYIMSHRIDTYSPEFSFRPKFSRTVQDLWAEQIIPVLLDHPSLLSVDDNAA